MGQENSPMGHIPCAHVQPLKCPGKLSGSASPRCGRSVDEDDYEVSFEVGESGGEGGLWDG